MVDRGARGSLPRLLVVEPGWKLTASHNAATAPDALTSGRGPRADPSKPACGSRSSCLNPSSSPKSSSSRARFHWPPSQPCRERRPAPGSAAEESRGRLRHRRCCPASRAPIRSSCRLMAPPGASRWRKAKARVAERMRRSPQLKQNSSGLHKRRPRQMHPGRWNGSACTSLPAAAARANPPHKEARTIGFVRASPSI